MKKSFGLIFAVSFAAIVFFGSLSEGDSTSSKNDKLGYSDFLNSVHKGDIKEVVLGDGSIIRGKYLNGSSFSSKAPNDPWLISDLLKYNVDVRVNDPGVSIGHLLLSWVPTFLVIGVMIFFMKKSMGGGGLLSFGSDKSKMISQKDNPSRLIDVAGCEEAKDEVAEIVDFLRDPAKFEKLGGRIPKGVLMVGSPGTGKTLLARAIAGESGVPFLSTSGSDFVEMFVGVGASRVRSMFATAKKHAPCIIFIDEIDAVGKQRGGKAGGGNDEREQTLNQLLVEMDGFEPTSGIIVIAATNRVDTLDPALLRPGRFDRQVTISLPDVRGREQILAVHMKKTPIAPSVNTNIIARGTPGFSGAQLANLVNEAALFAARGDKRLVDMDDFERAKDKIIMGTERRSAVMSDKERITTAYHEAGHVLVAKLLPNTDPVHKVTIIPRGRALGVTMQLPEEDRYTLSKSEALNNIAVLMGGRIAEEVFLDQITTGAGNDIERATQLAQRMITEWGMSKTLGPIAFQSESSALHSGDRRTAFSPETMREVDNEIREVIQGQYLVAKELIDSNRDVMEAMKEALLRLETLDAAQITALMERRPV